MKTRILAFLACLILSVSICLPVSAFEIKSEGFGDSLMNFSNNYNASRGSMPAVIQDNTVGNDGSISYYADESRHIRISFTFTSTGGIDFVRVYWDRSGNFEDFLGACNLTMYSLIPDMAEPDRHRALGMVILGGIESGNLAANGQNTILTGPDQKYILTYFSSSNQACLWLIKGSIK